MQFGEVSPVTAVVYGLVGFAGAYQAMISRRDSRRRRSQYSGGRDRALVGIRSAYYLVHSMDAGPTFAEVDRRAAGNFARAAVRAGVRQIIYLGGLTGDSESLSPHLKSRADTGALLRASGIPVVEFRASIVIGTGSLSFEMIRALVERLPLMVCPRWVATLTQPIAIDDVLACRIGGVAGWYFGDALWTARGWIDRCFGGVGMSRGRRDPDSCAVGATIDGWTVEAYEPDRRLRLSADFNLPGRGWLEFAVTPLNGGRSSLIRQTATFDPRGLLGRAYWYLLLPVHAVMFRGMLARIGRRAVEGGSQ